MTNNFIKDNLLPNEQIIASAKWHYMKNWTLAIIPFLFTIVCFITTIFGSIFLGSFFVGMFLDTIICIAITLILYYFNKWLNKYDEFVITNLRVVAKVGVIRRVAFELLNEQVESIGISQGIMGRIFGYGTLIIGGVGASKVRIRFVKDPFEIRQHFYNLKKGQ